MTSYIRFCSVQIKATKLLQTKCETDNRFSELQKVIKLPNMLMLKHTHYGVPSQSSRTYLDV